MLDNAQFSNCQNVEDYRNEMDRLITDAVQQLNLQSVSMIQVMLYMYDILLFSHLVNLSLFLYYFLNMRRLMLVAYCQDFLKF